LGPAEKGLLASFAFSDGHGYHGKLQRTLGYFLPFRDPGEIMLDILCRLPLLRAAALALLMGCAPWVSGQAFFDGYGGGYHASTAAEGAARGMADVTRSQGMRNLADSQAAINLTDARSAQIDNQIKSTNAYWERKNIYEENMAPRRYKQEQKRAKHRSRVMLQPLSASQFNPTTGAINWPPLLKQDQYSEYWEPLGKLFETRSQSGELSSNDYLEAKKLIREFRMTVTQDMSGNPDAAAPLRSSLRMLLELNRELDSNFS
jgi:hypothetical protein